MMGLGTRGSEALDCLPTMTWAGWMTVIEFRIMIFKTMETAYYFPEHCFQTLNIFLEDILYS